MKTLLACCRIRIPALVTIAACSLAWNAHAQDAFEPDNTFTSATQLTMGEWATNHTLHSTSDVDYLSLPIPAINHAFTIELAGLTSQFTDLAPVMRLYATNGLDVLVTASNLFRSFAPSLTIPNYPISTAGTYYVAISNTAESTPGSGPYRLRVYDLHVYEPDDTPGLASNITAGIPQANRALHGTTDVDFATFDAIAGRYYSITLADQSLYTILSLCDTNGTTLLAAATNANGEFYRDLTITYPVTNAGTYFIRVENNPPEAEDQYGPYTLSVTQFGTGDEYEPDDTPGSATSITSGIPQYAHTIHRPGDPDYAKFTALASNHLYSFEASNVTTEATISLRDSTGTNILKSAANHAFLGTPMFLYPIGSTGTYFVAVEGYNAALYPTGSYDLVVTDLGPFAPDPFEPDDTPETAAPLPRDIPQTNRTIHIGADVDYVRITVASNRIYTIQTGNLRHDLDTYLTLFDTNGITLLAEDDNSAGDLASSITYDFATGGVYYVMAESSSGGTLGAYSLRFTETDTDEDGLPDWYERIFTNDCTSLSATADSDSDGASNRDEYRAGTDPTNNTSILKVAAASSPDRTWPVIHWPGVAGRLYWLERATNLSMTPAFITTIHTNIPAVIPLNTVTDQTATGTGPWFYRIGVEP